MGLGGIGVVGVGEGMGGFGAYKRLEDADKFVLFGIKSVLYRRYAGE